MAEETPEKACNTHRDAEQVLYRRWQGRISGWRGLIKQYWLFALCQIYIYLIVLLSSPMNHYAETFLLILFARLQIAAIPPSIILTDFQASNWDTIKSLPLSAREIFHQYRRFCRPYAILPITLLTFQECLFIGTSVSSFSYYIYNLILILLSIIIFSYFLEGCGLCAVMIFPTRTSIYTALVGPVILALLFASPVLLVGVQGNLNSIASQIAAIAALFAAPEFLIFFLYSEGIRLPGGHFVPLELLIAVQILVTLFVWFIAWDLLRLKRS